LLLQDAGISGWYCDPNKTLHVLAPVNFIYKELILYKSNFNWIGIEQPDFAKDLLSI
jgi:hypothetical protein